MSDNYDDDILASEKQSRESELRNNFDDRLLDSHHYNILDVEPPIREYYPYGHSALSKKNKVKKTVPDLEGLIDNDSDED